MAPSNKEVEPALAKRLDAFRKKVAKEAEEVIFHVFPDKILTLTELIESTNAPSSPFHSSHASTLTDSTVYPPPSSSSDNAVPESKKRKLDGDGKASVLPQSNDTRHAVYPNLVRANKHVEKVQAVVQEASEELAELIDKVKLWINLTMPQIEDGDNFGVQIQEDVLNELQRSHDASYSLRDQQRQDHLARAKICSKLCKYPNLEDYTLALEEHDKKQLYFARQHLFDLRHIYAVLTDILHKNIAKIRAPKANNSISLY